MAFNPLDILSIASGGLSGYLASRSQRKQREADALRAKENTQASIASDESGDDPFRQQLAQAGALGRLDAMGNATFAPRTIAPPARYAGSMPTIGGGFSWQPSAQLQGDARALQTSVRAGRTAPTMANPANYGRTAALDLVSIAAGRGDPTAPVAPSQAGGGLAGGMLRQQQVRQFEREHPGWTLDAAGQPVRLSQ
jgi:hypothetical protein